MTLLRLPDPYDFENILLDGNNIHADNNNNLAYFNNAKVNRLLAAANRFNGSSGTAGEEKDKSKGKSKDKDKKPGSVDKEPGTKDGKDGTSV